MFVLTSFRIVHLFNNVIVNSKVFITLFIINIQVGSKLPSVDLFEDTPANKVNLAKLSAGKKIIVFAVPGAFTPGCSKVYFLYLYEFSLFIFVTLYKFYPFIQTHLPGFVQKANELKSKGINDIYCVSVNDAFVMAAWGKEQGTSGKVLVYDFLDLIFCTFYISL